jgi:hypothetical protein
MRGGMAEFLDLVAEKRELAEELVELAARHDFEFIGDDELSDADLETVSGGTGDLKLLALQDRIQRSNRQVVLISNVMRGRHDTAKSAISNLRS